LETVGPNLESNYPFYILNVWELDMADAGFYSEWVSIGNNRIKLTCRDGFPDHEEHFIAKVAAECLKNNSRGAARVTQVFYDDKGCVHAVHIASTDEIDRGLELIITRVLQSIYNSGSYVVIFELVGKGNENSDHYNHMEHLSRSTGVLG
jgi:hypothetical protein